MVMIMNMRDIDMNMMDIDMNMMDIDMNMVAIDMGVAMNVCVTMSAVNGDVVRMGKVTRVVVKMAVSLCMCIFDRLGEGLIGYITWTWA